MTVEGEAAGDGPVPSYLGIAKVLRDEIEGGGRPVGSQLPKQEALAKRFGTSRPTIQRALEQLRADGYIDSQQGRGPYVLDWRRAHNAVVERSLPGPAGVVLAKYVGAAFEADNVTLDAFSLTSESLNTALAGPLVRIRSGEIRPKSITIRLLLPSFTVHLAVPRFTDEGKADDERPRERLRRLMQSHAHTLQSSITALTEPSLALDASVEIRTVLITPLHKVYLLNGTEALHGFYDVVPREVLIQGKDMEEIYDFKGHEAVLFHYSAAGANPSPHDAEYVKRSQLSFDSIWTTVAEPFIPFA